MANHKAAYHALALKLHSDGLADAEIAANCGASVKAIAQWRYRQKPSLAPNKRPAGKPAAPETASKQLPTEIAESVVPEKYLSPAMAPHCAPGVDKAITVSQLAALLGEIALDAPDAPVYTNSGETIASVRYSAIMAPGRAPVAGCMLLAPE